MEEDVVLDFIEDRFVALGLPAAYFVLWEDSPVLEVALGMPGDPSEFEVRGALARFPEITQGLLPNDGYWLDLTNAVGLPGLRRKKFAVMLTALDEQGLARELAREVAETAKKPEGRRAVRGMAADAARRHTESVLLAAVRGNIAASLDSSRRAGEAGMGAASRRYWKRANRFSHVLNVWQAICG